ncbi:hypothetical protein QJS66_18870 [Kocuria rhizophila]|nr:hypothetical protein QJS66_18870 [Kocuria rhizophila]
MDFRTALHEATDAMGIDVVAWPPRPDIRPQPASITVNERYQRLAGTRPRSPRASTSAACTVHLGFRTWRTPCGH